VFEEFLYRHHVVLAKGEQFVHCVLKHSGGHLKLITTVVAKSVSWFLESSLGKGLLALELKVEFSLKITL